MKTRSTIHLITALTLGMHLAVFAAEDPHKNPVNPPAEDSTKEYPLDTCVVSGMKLGSMGEPFIHKVGDKEVRFCCKGCLPKFEKDPAKYLKKIEAADADKANEGTTQDPHSGHHH